MPHQRAARRPGEWDAAVDGGSGSPRAQVQVAEGAWWHVHQWAREPSQDRNDPDEGWRGQDCPAVLKVGRQGSGSPLGHRRIQGTVTVCMGLASAWTRPLFLSGAKDRTGTRGGHSSLQDVGEWLRPRAQQERLGLRPSQSGGELSSRGSLF